MVLSYSTPCTTPIPPTSCFQSPLIQVMEEEMAAELSFTKSVVLNKTSLHREKALPFLFILFRNPAFQTRSRINSENPDNTESVTSFPHFPSLFSQVHFPKMKLHYAAILLSQGKVIIFSCRHPLSVVQV